MRRCNPEGRVEAKGTERMIRVCTPFFNIAPTRAPINDAEPVTGEGGATVSDVVVLLSSVDDFVCEAIEGGDAKMASSEM
jgi:hypothetical protein